ncbi:MAG: DUF177 domain-containing protein [Spirulina sp. DLM2.Bin59]|nr:MAG: DUF177 domain-containing protein [Spirulina sp. DLM2.Bin59]
MKPIFIPHLLQAPDRCEQFELEDFIPDLESLTPVRGTLSVTHQTNYLDVRSQAETIVTLTCHRCLAHYNHRLTVDTQEIIWLETSQPGHPHSEENQGDELLETLSPQGYFDPLAWLYEQLSLALPFQQVCGENCQGVKVEPIASEPMVDHRWAELARLKEQLAARED